MRWPWRRRRDPHENGEAAKARADAARRLADTMRRQPQVERAKDHFAQLVEQALRGYR